eukprot:jgi/Undpi1/12500/HiC_scaffold_5.g02171.m1
MGMAQDHFVNQQTQQNDRRREHQPAWRKAHVAKVVLRPATAVQRQFDEEAEDEEREDRLRSEDAGFKPAVQGKMIEALTGARPNPRAIQNHAATHGRKKKSPYDASELLERVKAATGDGGKYLLKMDNEGRMTHLFWMTASQAFFGDCLKMLGRLSESGFEESFEELVEKYPKAEEYLRHTL